MYKYWLLQGSSRAFVKWVVNASSRRVDTVSTLNHNQSTSLTETLKRAFIAMERRDLLSWLNQIWI